MNRKIRAATREQLQHHLWQTEWWDRCGRGERTRFVCSQCLARKNYARARHTRVIRNESGDIVNKVSTCGVCQGWD